MSKRLKFKIASIIFLILGLISFIIGPVFAVRRISDFPSSDVNHILLVILGYSCLIVIPIGIGLYFFLKISELDAPKIRAERIIADIEHFINQNFLLSPEGIKNQQDILADKADAIMEQFYNPKKKKFWQKKS